MVNASIAVIGLLAWSASLISVGSAFVFYPPGLRPSGVSPVTGPTSLTDLRAEANEDSETDGVSNQDKPSSGSNDILNSPAFLKRKLEVLKSDLNKAEGDLEAAKARLDEGKAEWGPQLEELEREYKNIQDRLNTQSKTGDSAATVSVTRQMLQVLDNYDRAFGAVIPSNDAEKEIETEYRKTYDMILQTFKDLGVEEVETVGKEFNYEFMQAIMQRPSDEYEEGIVCEEYQKGFRLGSTLVRAAVVAVAA